MYRKSSKFMQAGPAKQRVLKPGGKRSDGAYRWRKRLFGPKPRKMFGGVLRLPPAH
jgi:hypothetical protein